MVMPKACCMPGAWQGHRHSGYGRAAGGAASAVTTNLGEPKASKSVIRYRRGKGVVALARGGTRPAVGRMSTADEDSVRAVIHRFALERPPIGQRIRGDRGRVC